MPKRLEGKTILITGASSGIGRSIALEFARTCPNDLRLILTSRRLPALNEVAASINQELGPGVKIHTQALDISNSLSIASFLPSLPDKFKDIDILINNAGLATSGLLPVQSIPFTEIATMYRTNILGLVTLTQSTLSIFLSRSPPSGDILSINSIAGHYPYAGGSIYCSSKAALHSFSSSLRQELIDTDIRIMEIAPGQVETEFSVVRYGGDREAAGKVYEGVEALTPGDVAEVVVWMCGRRRNVVVADVQIVHVAQAGADCIHRNL